MSHPELTGSPPRWSVVIPLYNMVQTIDRAIDSVVAQTETDWELVVVDDGSSDGASAVAASRNDSRISVIRQANAGVSAARNRGAEAARASLVTFLDADDQWMPGHLANLQRLADLYPHAVVYATAYQLVHESGDVRCVRLRPGTSPVGIMADYFAECVDIEVPICASGVAVRKAALDQVGGFPVGISAGEDLITWSRLACAGAVAYSTDPTTHVWPPTLAAQGRGAAVRRPDRPDYVGAALAELARSHPERARSITRYRAWWHRLCALAYAELGARSESLGEIQRAIVVDRPTTRDAAIAVLSVIPGWLRGRVLAKVRLRRLRQTERA